MARGHRESIRRRRPAVREHGRSAGRNRAELRRWRVAGGVRVAAAECDSIGAPRRAGHAYARRRRHPGRHVLNGQGAGAEPRPFERACDRGSRRSSRRCRWSSRPTTFESTRSCRDALRPIACSSWTKSTRSARASRSTSSGSARRRRIPFGRYGRPEEFGRVGAFLLSDAASYITGASVQVDGGLIQRPAG